MQKKEFDSATHFMHQEVLQEQEQKKIVDSAVLDEVLVQQHAKFLENQGHGSKQTVVSHTMQAPLEKKIFDSADHFLSLAEQERLREQLDVESKEQLRMMQEAQSKSPTNAGLKSLIGQKAYVVSL